jgi:hypothetical protein
MHSEYFVRTEGRGRTVDQWKQRAEHRDNHWWDCLVGCAVAASVQGVVLLGPGDKSRGDRPRIRLSELQKGRR